MTITVRNNVLRAGLIVSMLVFVGFLVVLAAIYTAATPGRSVSDVLGSKDQFPNLVALVRLLAILAYSLGGGFLLQRFFRKTVSSEMFFFTFFVISMSLEAFNAGQILLQLNDTATYYGVILTRVACFGRSFGVFCLLISGLYATGIEYQKYEVVLGIALLLAFALAFSIPIDSSTFLPTLVYRTGGSTQLLAIFFGLELLAVLNFLLSAFLSQTRDYVMMAAGLAMVIAGVDLLFFVAGLTWGIVGFILLVAGTVVFGNRTHAVYLWD